MRFAAVWLIAACFFCSGCMYRGNLKDSFYVPNNTESKLPIKAYVVFDRTLETTVYYSSNIFRGIGVDISTNPGLKYSMVTAFESVFKELHSDNIIDQVTIKYYDVLVIPRVEINQEAVTVSVTLKDAVTDNILNSYKYSGSIYNTIPASAHILQVINIIPFAGLTTPIIIPVSTSIIGGEAEKDIEKVFRHALTSIADDIRNDRSLLMKLKK